MEREKKKYEICQDNSIKLYRLREKEEQLDNFDKLADAVIVLGQAFSNDENGHSLLSEALRELFSQITENPLDIDTKRDKGKILENYLTVKEENSLQILYPLVAEQWHPTRNEKLTPAMFSAHSNARVWWLGECGHEWEAPITVRTRGNGCPYCAGQKVLKGFNDLQTVFPEIASQWHPTKNGKNTPDMYTYGSGHRAFWLCSSCKQEWEARINMRTSAKRGCPYCTHEKPIIGLNDLVTVRPDLMVDWDYDKNEHIDPTKLLPNSNKKVWWKCSKCGYKYMSFISNRNRGTGCKKCAGKVLISGENDLHALFPAIAKEWDYERNEINPSQVFPKANKKYYWICKLGHSWKATPNARTNGRGCPYCSGNKVLLGFNDLKTTHPDIAKQWHPTKNAGLLPTQISRGYTKKVWFLCKYCQNAYESYIGNKVKGYGKCPICKERENL